MLRIGCVRVALIIVIIITLILWVTIKVRPALEPSRFTAGNLSLVTIEKALAVELTPTAVKGPVLIMAFGIHCVRAASKLQSDAAYILFSAMVVTLDTTVSRVRRLLRERVLLVKLARCSTAHLMQRPHVVHTVQRLGHD